MIYKTKVRHDAFTFSLAGMSAVASVIAPPIVASDRLSKALDAATRGCASQYNRGPIRRPAPQ